MDNANPNLSGHRWIFIAGDPLRGFSALGLLVLHAAVGSLLVTGNPGGGAPAVIDAYGTVVGSLLSAGYFGLWVFFGLSGYLIGRPFVRALVDGRPLPALWPYGRRRALRILPPYWTVLTLIVVIFVWLLGRADATLRQIAELYVFDYSGTAAGQRIAQGWSLGVEAKFYVVLPIAALLAVRPVRALRGPRARALAIAVPCLLWVLLAPLLVSGQPEVRSFDYLLRLFGAGIALAALEPLLQPLVSGRRRWSGVALTLTAIGLLYVLATPALLNRVGAPFSGSIGDVALDAAVMLLIAGPLLHQWVDGGCWTTLDNPLTRWLGSRSYSFYLVHLLVVLELGNAFADPGDGYRVTLAWLLPAALVVSLAVAEVLYRAVERPCLMRKRRLHVGESAGPSAFRHPTPIQLGDHLAHKVAGGPSSDGGKG